MTAHVVDAATAASLRTSKAEARPLAIIPQLMAGEVIWTDDNDDLAGLRGQKAPFAATHDLRVQKGEQDGKSGWFVWLVEKEED